MESLGSGQFGTVNKGIWQSPMGAMEVAVKQLQPGASEEEKVKFLQEAAINGQFRHPNLVKLMGVVTVGEPVSHYCSVDVLTSVMYRILTWTKDDIGNRDCTMSVVNNFDLQAMIVLELLSNGNLRDVLNQLKM